MKLSGPVPSDPPLSSTYELPLQSTSGLPTMSISDRPIASTITFPSVSRCDLHPPENDDSDSEETVQSEFAIQAGVLLTTEQKIETEFENWNVECSNLPDLFIIKLLHHMNSFSPKMHLTARTVIR